ncbi:2136_t:CDS:2, partial [Diversispora eburnea]
LDHKFSPHNNTLNFKVYLVSCGVGRMLNENCREPQNFIGYYLDSVEIGVSPLSHNPINRERNLGFNLNIGQNPGATTIYDFRNNKSIKSTTDDWYMERSESSTTGVQWLYRFTAQDLYKDGKNQRNLPSTDIHSGHCFKRKLEELGKKSDINKSKNENNLLVTDFRCEKEELRKKTNIVGSKEENNLSVTGFSHELEEPKAGKKFVDNINKFSSEDIYQTDFFSVKATIRFGTTANSNLEKLLLEQKDTIDNILKSQSVYAVGPNFQQGYSIPCIACYVSKPLEAQVLLKLSALFGHNYEIVEQMVEPVEEETSGSNNNHSDPSNGNETKWD